MKDYDPWLHRFAVLTALATLCLIGIGGLVTSHEAGMAVPDWPTSYGYNMFALPFRFWSGGVFYEHTHRLWASTVGLLVVLLTRWLGGRPSRGPLAVIGLIEVLAGVVIVWIKPDLKGAGHFLSGIGGVVLLAALVWARSQPASQPLRRLGWAAFWLVQAQGLLGGLRVVLLKDEIGILHAALAQLFLVLLAVIALFTNRRWTERQPPARLDPNVNSRRAGPGAGAPMLRRLILVTTILIFLQLILGATMRHQHAGLAISDFPLAHGKLWPDMGAGAVARYNVLRIETAGENPITAFQIGLQMAHRVAAGLIFVAVGVCAWLAGRDLGWRNPMAKLSVCWLSLIFSQLLLGAATIWSNKAADIATGHVMVGALSLVTGVILSLVAFRRGANVAVSAGAARFQDLKSESLSANSATCES